MNVRSSVLAAELPPKTEDEVPAEAGTKGQKKSKEPSRWFLMRSGVKYIIPQVISDRRLVKGQSDMAHMRPNNASTPPIA
jgi:hypothetical protein